MGYVLSVNYLVLMSYNLHLVSSNMVIDERNSLPELCVNSATIYHFLHVSVALEPNTA